MATIKKQLTLTFKQPNIAESYGPYTSVSEAHEALSEDQLNVIGMTVGVEDSTTHTIEEYWYQGGTSQVNLVKKQSPKVEANPEDPEGEHPSAIELLTLKIDELVYMIPESAEPDAQLSSTSTNSVLNKVVKAALDGKAPSSNILKNALANDVQTSLSNADTAVQPADIADFITESELNTGLASKQNTISASNKISSDFVDDASGTNKFVTSTEKGLISTAIQGVKKGTETLTPESGVVTIPSDIESAQATSVPSNQSATATIDSSHVLQLEIPRGADAVNPFKGMYITTSDTNIPSSGQAGDYIFIADANPATTIDLYFWNTAKTPSAGWDDTGYDINPGSLAEFAGGTAVSMVRIINDFTTGGSGNVASAETVKTLNGKLLTTIDLYSLLPNNNKVYTTNGAVGSVVNLTPSSSSSGWSSGIFDCVYGDKFYISATGGSSARLWCFVDNENKIISNAEAGSDTITLTAPQNATKLIVNINTNYSPHIVQKFIDRLSSIEDEMGDIETEQASIEAGQEIINKQLIQSFILPGYLIANGTVFGSSTSSMHTQYLLAVDGLHIKNVAVIGGTAVNKIYAWFFDETLTLVGTLQDSENASGLKDFTLSSADIPSGAVYVACNIDPNYLTECSNVFVVPCAKQDKAIAALNTALSGKQDSHLVDSWSIIPSATNYPSEKLVKESIDETNASLGEEVSLTQQVESISQDVVVFPYIAKSGDVLHIEVLAQGVLSSDPDNYMPLYANGGLSGNYITIYDGASKDFTLSVDCTSLKIIKRGSFVGTGNITIKVTNKSSIIGRIEVLEQSMGNKPEIILPNKLTAVVGHEFNIYLDSILLTVNNDNYQKQWSGTIPANNRALACGLRFTPTTVLSPTNIALTLSDKITGEQVVKKVVQLKVIADSAVTGKKVIFIGDSLTDAGYYPAEIQHNLSNGGIISLGTRSDTVTINGQSLTTNNEGRSGWSPQNYVNNQTFGGINNAFWNPSTSKFDFSYYMTQQGYSSVDVVCLCLGTNGYPDLEDAISALDEMIASIHDYDQNIIILVTMITPPAYQDGVGYSSGYTSSDGMFRGMMNYNKRVLQKYGNRDDNVDIIPWYINLNRKYDFPTQEERFSARNPEMVIRQKDNVHPTVYGYLGMADVMYCVLLDKLSN